MFFFSYLFLLLFVLVMMVGLGVVVFKEEKEESVMNSFFFLVFFFVKEGCGLSGLSSSFNSVVFFFFLRFSRVCVRFRFSSLLGNSGGVGFLSCMDDLLMFCSSLEVFKVSNLNVFLIVFFILVWNWIVIYVYFIILN